MDHLKQPTQILIERVSNSSTQKKNSVVIESHNSMCLALTRTNLADTYSDDKEKQLRALFDPIVKPSMRESWENQWRDWFVTTNSVIDQRTPGKLKGFHLFQNKVR